MLAGWNDTRRDYPQDLTIHSLVARQVAANPNALAVVHRAAALTYRGLDRRAGRWAARLHNIGVRPGAYVGVHLDRSVELVAVLLGVLKAGAAYVPLDPAYPRERLEFMAEDARMDALVTERPEALTEVRRPMTVLTPRDLDAPDGRTGSGPRDRTGRVAGHPEQVAYVLYTSGSTGRPKGVALTHANAVDLLFWCADTFGADLRRVLATTSICFDCSILEIFGPLSTGGVVVLGDSAVDIGGRTEVWGVHLLHTVPSVVNKVLDADRLPSSVRTAIVGGETLLPILVDKVYAGSSIERLVNLYGPTECTSYATMAVAARGSADTPPIGRPVANTRIYLLDSAGDPVPAGAPGEIFIAGRGVTRGYLRRPGHTAARFLPDAFSGRPGERLYRTGDLGRHDPTGELRFLGRVDEQLKVRGVRIEPGEVEQALLAHPAVLEVAVAAVRDSSDQSILVAYVVVDPRTGIRAHGLRSYLRSRVPAPLVPSAFVLLDRLPRAPNGKVDRRRLPVPATAARGAAAGAPARPGTELESMLAATWAEVADLDEVDIEADIFDLGGHSLAALQVRGRVMELLGADIPIRVFFEEPTLAALAARIERDLDATTPIRAPAGAEASSGGARIRGALSPNQRAILARADAQPDEPGLMLPLVGHLTGRLHLNALADALAAVVRRLEILRSVVVAGSDGSCQLVPVAGGDREPIALVDLTGLDAGRREEIARRLAHRLVSRPLRIRAAPPLRYALLRLADDDHVLAIAVHHIAADVWSIEMLSHQLLGRYAAAIHGRPPADRERVRQHADWAAEQLERLDSPAGQAQRRYWRDRLAELPALRLPGDDRRCDTPGAGIQHVFSVPPGATAALRELARAEQATPFIALLAAFAATLRAWTGQTDLGVGCPTSGRADGHLTTLLGPCMDALVLRCDVAGDPSFREVLRRVKDRALEAYANDGIPFACLADESGREAGRHPLFQASIVLQQWPSLLDPAYRAAIAGREQIGDVTMSRFLTFPVNTTLDVGLSFFERDDELEGVLLCRSDVLSPDEAVALAEDFLTAVDRGVREPDTPIGTIRPKSVPATPVAGSR